MGRLTGSGYVWIGEAEQVVGEEIFHSPSIGTWSILPILGRASKALFTVGQGAESVENTPFRPFHVVFHAGHSGVLESTFPQAWEAPPAWVEDWSKHASPAEIGSPIECGT